MAQGRCKVNLSLESHQTLRQLAGLYGETLGETIDRALAVRIKHEPPTIKPEVLKALRGKEANPIP